MPRLANERAGASKVRPAEERRAVIVRRAEGAGIAPKNVRGAYLCGINGMTKEMVGWA